MAGPADLSRAVMLSLSAAKSSGPELLYPERRISLDRNNNSITIGRASKVSSKGFVAGLENAWFDSPVISRRHARFFARMDTKKLEITDLGSLHGTFLNGDERIPTNERRELKDGDTVRFGAPIWRGTEQFVPVTVKVGFRFPDRPGDGPSTFQVPEGSDDDGTDDDMSSDSDVNLKHANGHGQKVQNGSAHLAANAQVIDLTGGYGGRQARHIIDLSSPCGSPIRIADDDHEDSNGVSGALEDDIETTAGPTGFELEDSLATGNAGGMADQELGYLGVDYDTHEEYGSDISDLSIESDHDSAIDYPDEDSDSMLDDDQDTGSDEEMEESAGEYPSSDYDFDMDDMESLGDRNDDIWANMQYPEIMPLIASLSGPNVDSPPINTSESTAKTATSCSIQQLLNGDKSQSPIPGPRPDNNPVREQEDQTVDFHQQPSPPKDAFPMTPCPTAAATAVEALGAKTGKTAFFVAREANKMTLDALRAVNPRPTSSVHALCNAEEPVEEPRSFSFGPAVRETANSTETLPRILDPVTDLNFPSFIQPVRGTGITPEPCPAANDLPAALGSPVSLGGDVEGCSRRTHLGISDIVETCQPTAGGWKKRKADNISEATEEQERWAAKAAKALSPAPSVEEPHPESSEKQTEIAKDILELPVTIEIQEALAEPLAQDGETASVGPPAAPVVVPERPLKRARMMRVAERLGYAALGGVTAGAMIFGTLVYTAPSFG